MERVHLGQFISSSGLFKGKYNNQINIIKGRVLAHRKRLVHFLLCRMTKMRGKQGAEVKVSLWNCFFVPKVSLAMTME